MAIQDSVRQMMAQWGDRYTILKSDGTKPKLLGRLQKLTPKDLRAQYRQETEKEITVFGEIREHAYFILLFLGEQADTPLPQEGDRLQPEGDSSLYTVLRVEKMSIGGADFYEKGLLRREET